MDSLYPLSSYLSSWKAAAAMVAWGPESYWHVGLSPGRCVWPMASLSLPQPVGTLWSLFPSRAEPKFSPGGTYDGMELVFTS